MKQNETIKAYKGFNKDMTCRDFAYEVGKEYEHKGNVGLCQSGFHACENPFDVLDYYGDVLDNRYCEVEQSGCTEKDDKKTVSSKIKINAEIGWVGLFKAGIEWIKETTMPQKIENIGGSDDNGQNSAKIGSSGYSAKIGSSGDYAQIGSSGDSAQIDSSGADSVICCAGHGSAVKAKIGSLIT